MIINMEVVAMISLLRLSPDRDASAEQGPGEICQGCIH